MNTIRKKELLKKLAAGGLAKGLVKKLTTKKPVKGAKLKNPFKNLVTF